jgi:hypothetical protein
MDEYPAYTNNLSHPKGHEPQYHFPVATYKYIPLRLNDGRRRCGIWREQSLNQRMEHTIIGHSRHLAQTVNIDSYTNE